MVGRVQFSSCSSHFVCVVLIAHNFTELNYGRADYDYLAFCELFRFVFCLLQKVRRSSDLPVIEKWEAYKLPNHLFFGAIAEELFLEGTRLLSSLEKTNSSFLRKEFRRDCRRFPDDLVSTIPSTVSARSPVGQGLTVSLLRSSLEVTIILLSTSLGNCWIGSLNWAGSGGQKLNLRRLNSTLLCASSDGWKQAAIDLVCRSAACLPYIISLVSVLGRICTKLVLLCFGVILIFS